MDKTRSLTGLGIAGLSTLGLLGGTALGAKRTLRLWAQNPDPLEGVVPRMPGGERRTVAVDDGATIVVDTYQPTGPGPSRVVVFVHGLTATRHDWAPIASHLLSAGITVVTIEQRGHGDSTVGRDGYGSARLGDDLAAVLNDTALRPDALIGHSMGGMAVMAFAVRHPDQVHQQVGALGLIATTASLQSKRAQSLLRLASAPLPSFVTSSGGVAKNPLVRAATGRLAFGRAPSLPLIDRTIELSLRQDPADRVAATAALLAHDLSTEVASIDLPTFVVAGASDQMVPLADVKELASKIKRARFVEYQGAGHMVIWEEHAAIAAEIDQLIEGSSPVASSPVSTGRAGSDDHPDQDPT